MLLDPGSLSQNESKKHWLKKSINKCVLTGDPECILNKGKVVDRAIVSFSLQSHNAKEDKLIKFYHFNFSPTFVG